MLPPSRLVFALWLSLAGAALAADHFDGAITGDASTSDIADVYAFPAPEGRGLVLILNTAPRAGLQATFSDAVEYGFRLRPARVERSEWGVATRVAERELHLTCRFDLDDPEDPALAQTAHCRLTDDGMVVAATSVAVEALDGGAEPSLRVFAGLRADPFFTDAIRVRLPRPRASRLPELISTGNSMRPARTAVGVNLGGPRHTRRAVPNVLSIVVTLDLPTLLPDFGDRIAVVGETRRRAPAAEVLR